MQGCYLNLSSVGQASTNLGFNNNILLKELRSDKLIQTNSYDRVQTEGSPENPKDFFHAKKVLSQITNIPTIYVYMYICLKCKYQRFSVRKIKNSAPHAGAICHMFYACHHAAYTSYS